MADNNQITSGMQFRRALLQISKQLSESEVEEMKFLIAGLPDKPGFAELEQLKTGHDVFILLMKRGDISEENYYLLGYLLNEIGQKALVKRFKQLLSTGPTSPGTPYDTQLSSAFSPPGHDPPLTSYRGAVPKFVNRNPHHDKSTGTTARALDSTAHESPELTSVRADQKHEFQAVQKGPTSPGTPYDIQLSSASSPGHDPRLASYPGAVPKFVNRNPHHDKSIGTTARALDSTAHGSPVTNVTPAEILARGPKAYQAYVRASQDGTKHVYRTRIMIVGQERVGKTSLMKSITGQSFNESEEITDGIDAGAFIDIPEDRDSPWRIQEEAVTDFVKHMEKQHEDALCACMVQELKEVSERDKKVEDDATKNTQFADRDQTELSAADRGGSEEPENDTSSSRGGGDHEEELFRVPESISMIVAQQLQSNQDESILPEFHIWDFGGHDVYYTTHQVFLSHRAMYILVFDLRHDLTQPVKVQVPNTDKGESKFYDLTGLGFLDFWMQSIYAYATPTQQISDENKPQLSPPIFIVGTHRESLDISSDPQQRKHLVTKKFESIYDMIRDKPYEDHVVNPFYDIENSSNDQRDAKLSSLRKHILSVAVQEPYMGKAIPLKWLTFEKRVAEAIKEGIHFMELTKVQDMSKDLGIQADTLITMLTFYHDLGTIIYFGGDGNTNKDLQNMVILDPQWLIDIFKRIITVLPYQKQGKATLRSKWRKLKEEGILEDCLIDHMWRDLLPQKKALIALMEMFDLLCPQLAATEGEAACAYYVPACLQLCSAMEHPQLTRHKNDICTFYIDFKGFLPDGLFHRLLVHSACWSQQQISEVKPKLYYRYGNFFLDDVHDFQLRMQTTNPVCVEVTVGKTPEISSGDTDSQSCDASPDVKARVSVKTFLATTLNKLTKTWIGGITYEFSVACRCNDFVLPEVSKSLHLLPLEDCLMKPKIRCNEKKPMVVKTDAYRSWFLGGTKCNVKSTKPEDSTCTYAISSRHGDCLRKASDNVIGATGGSVQGSQTSKVQDDRFMEANESNATNASGFTSAIGTCNGVQRSKTSEDQTDCLMQSIASDDLATASASDVVAVPSTGDTEGQVCEGQDEYLMEFSDSGDIAAASASDAVAAAGAGGIQISNTQVHGSQTIAARDMYSPGGDLHIHQHFCKCMPPQ